MKSFQELLEDFKNFKNLEDVHELLRMLAQYSNLDLGDMKERACDEKSYSFFKELINCLKEL